MGKTVLAEICVDGCDVVSENSGSDVTNWLDLSNRSPTILDKINGTSGPPLPPISMMPKWRAFAPSRLHHCFGGDGG